MKEVDDDSSLRARVVVRFPLLECPYVVEDLVDCRTNAEDRRYWVDHFVRQAPSVAEYALAAHRFLRLTAPPLREEADGPEEEKEEDAAVRAARYVQDWSAWSATLQVTSVWELCVERERRLRAAGFSDAYAHVKHNENQAALRLLPGLLRELDQMSDAERLHTLIEGVFAGNIFDLGSFDTLKLFEQGNGGGASDFLKCRSQLPKRPWFVDDLDEIHARFSNSVAPYKKAILFVDNAGTDIVLGMVPLAREFLKRKISVVLTANSTPALNDITYPELVSLMQEIAQIDRLLSETLASGQLRLIPSGNGCPLIDLNCVSSELAQEAEDADLVILEGMGRAIQSNNRAQFRCDTMKLAMIKDFHIASKLGCSLLDCYCRFEQRHPRVT